MPHFRSAGFPGKTTFFVSGKLPSSCPMSLPGTSLGKSPLLMVWRWIGQRCVHPGRPSPECFTCRHQLQVPPAGGLISSVGQCCGACLVGFTVRVSFHCWGGRPGIFSLTFPRWRVTAKFYFFGWGMDAIHTWFKERIP